MDDQDKVNRRDFIATSAGAAGVATSLVDDGVGAARVEGGAAGLQGPGAYQAHWNKPLNEIVDVDLSRAAPELSEEGARERHRIYCYLLMKLIVRFWNGNKRGPLGAYPWRAKQIEPATPAAANDSAIAAT